MTAARVIIKIEKLMAGLQPDEQRLVAFYVHQHFGGPLTTGAIRTQRYRDRRRDGVTPVTLHGDARCDASANVTAAHVPPTPPVRVAPEIPVLKPENNSNYRKEAREVLEFLNVKAGKTFRVKDTNLKLIEARLRSGASVQDCKIVIARKVREWKTDAKMNEFLRPKTLFSATNFESYLGQAEPETPHDAERSGARDAAERPPDA